MSWPCRLAASAGAIRSAASGVPSVRDRADHDRAVHAPRRRAGIGEAERRTDDIGRVASKHGGQIGVVAGHSPALEQVADTGRGRIDDCQRDADRSIQVGEPPDLLDAAATFGVPHDIVRAVALPPVQPERASQ